MRVISAALQTAQESSSRTPYIELVFHNPITPDYVDYTDRCLGGEHHEEPFNGYATILLQNNDNDVQDLRGYYVEIGYGDYLAPTETVTRESHATARLWVISQTEISFPGKRICALELKDAWELLKKPCLMNREAPFHFYSFYSAADNLTVWSIVAALLLDAGFPLVGMTGNYTDWDAAFIEFIPAFTINQEATIPSSYISYKDAILTLLNMTSTYLRPKINREFQAVFPKDDDPVDETYYSYQAPWFKEFDYRKNVVIPNHVFVYCDIVDGVFNEPLLMGEAQDQWSLEAYGLPLPEDIISLNVAGDIRTQEDADRRAQAILDRIRIQSRGGRLIIPHDIRVELFDVVKVYDGRSPQWELLFWEWGNTDLTITTTPSSLDARLIITYGTDSLTVLRTVIGQAICQPSVGPFGFSNIKNGVGTGVTYNGAASQTILNLQGAETPGNWASMGRGILTFDTSAIPDNVAITSARLRLYVQGKWDEFNPTYINVYSASPASNTALVAADYNILNFGSVPFCDTPVNLHTISLLSWMEFALNTAGKTAINKTGFTCLGLRNSHDISTGVPTILTDRVTGVTHRWGPGHYSAELTLGGLSTNWDLISMSKEPLPSIPSDKKTGWEGPYSEITEEGMRFYYILPDKTRWYSPVAPPPAP